MNEHRHFPLSSGTNSEGVFARRASRGPCEIRPDHERGASPAPPPRCRVGLFGSGRSVGSPRGAFLRRRSVFEGWLERPSALSRKGRDDGTAFNVRAARPHTQRVVSAIRYIYKSKITILPPPPPSPGGTRPPSLSSASSLSSSPPLLPRARRGGL